MLGGPLTAAPRRTPAVWWPSGATQRYVWNRGVSTIGLDIAKSVFQVHSVDADGLVVIRRQLKRRYVLAFFEKLPACLVGIEACASSHHWSRELRALGHTVRLMPPAYVKPYVKRQKNDVADAEAICEAVTRSWLGNDRSDVWIIASAT
jgi:transposase